MAHELNNILAPILLSAPLLLHELSDENRESIVRTIAEGARRGTEIVKQVLTFARGIEIERILLDPNRLIRETADIVEKTFPKTIRLAWGAQAQTWPVRGDSTQLHQVFLNLAINARDAMKNGGELSLACENFVIDAHYASMLPGAIAGGYVLFTVSDTGEGILQENIQRIFDPFFTTREVGKGTGLGLSAVVGIAKSHGGFVNVYSEHGRGTTFKVFLPAVTDGDPVAEIPIVEEMPRGLGELVLVVDDEPAIRMVTEMILREYGYEVVTGADGTEGVALYTQYRGKIKVVLTDVVMPFFDGVALTRALKRMDPKVCIIVSSGHADDSRLSTLVSLGVHAFLEKPYQVAKLLTVLRDAVAMSSR